MLNGVALLLAWYATRVAAYFGFGVWLVSKHAGALRASGLEGALTVFSWAVGGALQLREAIERRGAGAVGQGVGFVVSTTYIAMRPRGRVRGVR